MKPKLQAPAKNDFFKFFLWVIVGILLAAILVGIGWFLGHQENDYDPYRVLKGYESSRHGFLVKSAEISVDMANRAIIALKKKKLNEAIEDCKTAIDIFPIDAKPYILLAKIYLMTGQEQKMYDTLTLAGHSYPNFNNIVSIIDDENLDKIPLKEPADNIYLANFPENKDSAMTFMFDDGEANVYKALPIFEKYGYRATIPVVAGFVAEKSNDPFWGSWKEWTDAANRGFEIANHSMFHRDSKNLHGADFDVAIDQAKDMIEKNIGHKVTAYVFPHDSYTDEAIQRALKGHELIRTSQFLRSTYDRTVDIVIGGHYVSLETANRLVDIAIKRKLWLIAKCHGVTDKASLRSFKSITPEFLEKNLAYIHSKDDQIWVDTFTHVFEYLAMRNHTKIETKDLTSDSIDFDLQDTVSSDKLSLPLTVIIKAQGVVNIKSAYSSSNHKLKAWVCDTNKICVDVDAFHEDVHVQW